MENSKLQSNVIFKTFMEIGSLQILNNLYDLTGRSSLHKFEFLGKKAFADYQICQSCHRKRNDMYHGLF